MTPHLRLLYLDESEYWDPAILGAAGRIAALYVYDKRRHVFCCEMTPSYEMHLLGYLTEHHVNDTTQMAMVEATEFGNVSYIHCWQIDGMSTIRRRPGFRDVDPFVTGRLPCTIALPGPFPRDHDDAIEEALEYLQANGFTTT